MWVGNLDDRTLTKIDVGRARLAGTFSLDDRTPTGIAVGADPSGSPTAVLGKLSAVDPEFGQVTKTIDVAGEALGVGERCGRHRRRRRLGRLRRFHARAHRSSRHRRSPGRTVTGTAPAGVVVADGYVWVVNTDSATVQRFEPETFEQGPLGTPTSVGLRPTAIAAGEGAIWVANTGADTVDADRVRHRRAAATTSRFAWATRPAGLAVGAGAVWVANAGDGTVSRIDPRSDEVVETIEIGNAPSGIAFGDGAVWVSVQSP